MFCSSLRKFRPTRPRKPLPRMAQSNIVIQNGETIAPSHKPTRSQPTSRRSPYLRPRLRLASLLLCPPRAPPLARQLLPPRDPRRRLAPPRAASLPTADQLSPPCRAASLPVVGQLSRAAGHLLLLTSPASPRRLPLGHEATVLTGPPGQMGQHDTAQAIAGRAAS